MGDDGLIANVLVTDDARELLAAERIPVREAHEALAGDPELRERLDTERATFLRDPAFEGVIASRLPGHRPADLRLAAAFAVVFGYHLLLVRAWPNLPWGFAVFGVAAYLAVLAIACRIGYRWIAPLRRLFRRVGTLPVEDLWRVYAVERIVWPALVRFVEEKRTPPDSTEFTYRAVDGLHAESPTATPVITGAGERLRTAVARSATGAIALAGHRGVGKTTAIRFVADGVLGDPDRPPLAVIASAPARYDARDFVLYLHALLCKEVITRTHGTGRPRRWATFARLVAPVRRRERAAQLVRSLLAHLVAIAVPVLLGAWAWGRPPLRFVTDPPPLFTGLTGWRIAVLVLAALVALVVVVDLAASVWRTARGLRPARRADPRLRELRAVAGQQLRRIRFLQTYTTGWSGKLTLPLKGEAGWTRSTQSAEQQLSYPEVVDEFRAFAEYAAGVLRAAHVTDRLVIAIDELDKIAEPEKAQELINDIKGVFDVPGCLFLVSVSDDAIVSFERRGIPARDAFDSAFSEMVRLDNFTPDDTRAWISRRVPGLPEQFVCLCHCLSGGLPRDLRRTVVELLDLPAGQPLSAVVELLVRRELDRKAHAFTGAARTVEPSPERSSLIADLVRIPAVRGPGELRALAARITSGEGLAALRAQAAAYLLFSATILEVFTDDLTRDRLYGVPGGEPQLLALARQQMAFDPRVSMDLLASVRAARGLAVE
ncbi:KAP family NTPase [Amycolatopsis thermalba]|uniref:KAP family NTPase n=1 Tax=Amycolatopsis thermalba TaxID=944492 RepID=A0ABY4P5F6_9PSEU|nr:KAP family NTPase [Amycolatopsis thermalba]UQS27547.1 KAP family NTPase [Amycolatopsis thermalba]